MVVASAAGKRNRELLLNGYGVAAGEDDKLLEMDGGDGSTAKSAYLMPLNYTLKNGESDKFYFMYKLSQLKKSH